MPKRDFIITSTPFNSPQTNNSPNTSPATSPLLATRDVKKTPDDTAHDMKRVRSSIKARNSVTSLLTLLSRAAVKTADQVVVAETPRTSLQNRTSAGSLDEEGYSPHHARNPKPAMRISSGTAGGDGVLVFSPALLDDISCLRDRLSRIEL
jgi:hypothetical protein